jgi:hypothetical protein
MMMPHCYSTEEATKFIPHLVERPLSVLRVLDPDKTKGMLSKDEHVYRFADMSAFDEETIQDAKYHRFAHELYYVLKGQVSVKWKHVSDEQWNSAVLTTDEEKKWIHIPPLHCLFLQKPTGMFLAVAFKTEESTKASGNKVQGDYCKIMSCKVRQECVELQRKREDFFKNLKVKST